jgi:hypothetical protein
VLHHPWDRGASLAMTARRPTYAININLLNDFMFTHYRFVNPVSASFSTRRRAGPRAATAQGVERIEHKKVL